MANSFLSFFFFLRIALYHPLVLCFRHSAKFSLWDDLPGCQNDAVISEVSVMDNQGLEAKLANSVTFYLLLNQQF